MNKATLNQAAKILSLFEKTSTEQLQAILGSGFLADIFSTSLLGVTALAKTAMGFLTGTFQSRVISRSVLWPALLCWAASIFHEIIKFLAWKIVGAEGTPPFLFLSVLWLATYNMLLVLAVYPLLKRILPEREEALVMFNR